MRINAADLLQKEQQPKFFSHQNSGGNKQLLSAPFFPTGSILNALRGHNRLSTFSTPIEAPVAARQYVNVHRVVM